MEQAAGRAIAPGCLLQDGEGTQMSRHAPLRFGGVQQAEIARGGHIPDELAEVAGEHPANRAGHALGIHAGLVDRQRAARVQRFSGLPQGFGVYARLRFQYRFPRDHFGLDGRLRIWNGRYRLRLGRDDGSLGCLGCLGRGGLRRVRRRRHGRDAGRERGGARLRLGHGDVRASGLRIVTAATTGGQQRTYANTDRAAGPQPDAKLECHHALPVGDK
ncbi:hypothetical protein D3C87_1220900 [compost metagenome]